MRKILASEVDFRVGRGVDGSAYSALHNKVYAFATDSRMVALVGSANATNNSCVNGELALKVTGKVVAKGVYDKAWSEALRVETY